MSVTLGSGRPSLPKGLKRSATYRVNVHEWQRLDVEAIAKAWNVPPSTVCYAAVAAFVRTSDRKRGPLSLEDSTILAASRRFVKAHSAHIAD
jgi:hypothetical protein